ncbi:response regulator [bacterium]|nr:response regulator [bacterium]
MAKILVVDDSETVRHRLVLDLQAAGHEVIEAEDGVKGLQTLNSNQDTNIVISDINMPEMDGITMCSKINENERFKDIHLFVLTTEFDSDLKTKGKKAGVKLWITKPVKMAKLTAVIQKVLER